MKASGPAASHHQFCPELEPGRTGTQWLPFSSSPVLWALSRPHQQHHESAEQNQRAQLLLLLATPLWGPAAWTQCSKAGEKPRGESRGGPRASALFSHTPGWGWKKPQPEAS